MNRSANGRWLVVYMCRGRQKAMDMEKLLTDEGSLVRSQVMGGEDTYEIHALESEAQEARNFILENGL